MSCLKTKSSFHVNRYWNWWRSTMFWYPLASCNFHVQHVICRPNAITLSCRFECLTHHCSVRLSFVGWFWLLAHICQQLIYLPIPRYSQRCWTAFPALKQKQKDPVSIETLMARQNQCKLFCGFLKNILHCGRMSSAKWQSKQKLHLSFKSAVSIFLET